MDLTPKHRGTGWHLTAFEQARFVVSPPSPAQDASRQSAAEPGSDPGLVVFLQDIRISYVVLLVPAVLRDVNWCWSCIPPAKPSKLRPNQHPLRSKIAQSRPNRASQPRRQQLVGSKNCASAGGIHPRAECRDLTRRFRKRASSGVRERKLAPSAARFQLAACPIPFPHPSSMPCYPQWLKSNFWTCTTSL